MGDVNPYGYGRQTITEATGPMRPSAPLPTPRLETENGTLRYINDKGEHGVEIRHTADGFWVGCTFVTREAWELLKSKSEGSAT